MNIEQKEFLENKYFIGKKNIIWLKELKNKLLEIEKNTFLVTPKFDDDINILLKHGVVFKNTDKIIKWLKPSQCHENSLIIYLNNDNKYDIYTWYALSDDWLWRQHSWLIDKKNNKTIETTVWRVKYFWFKLKNTQIEEWRDLYFI